MTELTKMDKYLAKHFLDKLIKKAIGISCNQNNLKINDTIASLTRNSQPTPPWDEITT